MDFTLDAYGHILHQARRSGYSILSFDEWFAGGGEDTERLLLLRHDVDRRPQRALKMAQMEADMGVRASYYFRIVRGAFRPEIIRAIADMGHEIGYHYEDWFLARYDKDKAISLYRRHMAQFREITPVTTIAMHGSPLARESNLTIWEHHNLCEEGVKDVIRSADFSQFAFFTDTGRTFGESKANLRDFVGAKEVFSDIRTSDDLIAFLARKAHPRVYLSVHPERWTNHPVGWAGQLARDKVINGIKLVLRTLHGMKSDRESVSS